MKPFFFLLSFLITALPFTAAADKLQIGSSLPLSGGSASEGADIKNMLIFANETLTGSAFSLSFEDDQCSDQQAVTIAKKLTDIERVRAVVGFACSGAVLASAPVYERAKTPVIAVATGAPKISEAGEYIFRTIPNLNVAAQKLHDHAAKHYKKVAILSEETAYSQGLETAFLQNNSSGVLTITTEHFLPGTTDFRATLLKIKASAPDAVFLNPQSESGLIVIYRQLRDLGWKPALYATYYPGFAEFRKTFGSSADGIIFADLPFLETSLDNQGKNLFEQYVAKFGRPQSSEFYFITVLAAVHALHRATVSGNDIKEFLLAEEFHSPVGVFRFDRNGDIQGSAITFTLKTLKSGVPISFPSAK